jgi:hypothetical protein
MKVKASMSCFLRLVLWIRAKLQTIMAKPLRKPGSKSGMFTRRAFAVIVIPDDNPLNAMVTVVRSSRWESSPLACLEVLDLVSFTVGSTDRAVLCRQCKRCEKS